MRHAGGVRLRRSIRHHDPERVEARPGGYHDSDIVLMSIYAHCGGFPTRDL